MDTKLDIRPNKLRIIISSNAIWATSGYAQQVAEFYPLIRDEGYSLAQLDFYGLEGGKIEIDGITHYPRIGDVWGNDALIPHGNDFKADISMTLQDIWVLDPNMLRSIKRWIPIVPIDHDPIPPAILQRLKLAYRIVTYSKFGQQELRRNGLYSTYIPHTVNTEVYKPEDKAEAKKAIGVDPNLFLFGMVAANKDNPPRKSFQEVMDGFARFHKVHPKSGIYFHTLLEMQGGFNIKEYAAFLGIQDVVFKLEPYDQMFKIGKKEMAKIYNAFDVLMAPSQNEGFGVPIIEAQSCGVPVITNNFTAMPELIVEGETGLLTKVGYKRFTPLGSYVGMPDAESVYDKMERIYTMDRVKMSKKAREHMVENYDTKRIFKEKWKPFLTRLEDEIYPKILDKAEA